VGRADISTQLVERFLQWARTAPVSRRTDAAHALARAYLVSPLTQDQRDRVEAAMTFLLDDGASEVRLALADALAASEQAPHHIILSLAADRPPIAAVVAELSPLILDSELVDMIATREEEVQAAIARRPFVSRALAAAIAEVGCLMACLTLLGNEGARVPRFSLDRIVERHGDRAELRNILLERDDLPLDVRQALLARLTASLCDLVVSREWMSAERAEAVTRDARERATIAAAFEAPAADMPALIERLIAAKELSPAFLIRAAASGQTLLFEAALARLARMPQPRVRALLASGRESGLKALFEKAGLPAKTFPAFIAAIEVIRGGDAAATPASDYRRATQLIDAIVTRYERRQDRELDQILALLRHFATEAKRAAARGFAQQVLEEAA
jgi:uncharacterized protein (DUF2336 family)